MEPLKTVFFYFLLNFVAFSLALLFLSFFLAFQNWSFMSILKILSLGIFVLGLCSCKGKKEELPALEKIEIPQLQLESLVLLPNHFFLDSSQRLLRQQGTWRILRITLKNNGEEELKGIIRAYEAGNRFSGDTYTTPFEIPLGSLKEIDIKVPGVQWTATPNPQVELSFETNKGVSISPPLALPDSHYLAKNCWVLSHPSSNKNVLYGVLNKYDYKIEETSPRLLPRSWVGYQGVELVVLFNETLESLEPAQAEAFRYFLEIGGRVLLFTGGELSFLANHVLFDAPLAPKAGSVFQTGLKQVIGYDIDAETEHFLKPRGAHCGIISTFQGNHFAVKVARSLAPEIPSKSTILVLLFLFFFVALVLNRLFCNYLRKPELTYPIFLVLSIIYFFGVYSLGWQVEDHSIKTVECSFSYLPPTGKQLYVRSVVCLISGVAQPLQEIKLPKNHFIFPQNITSDTYGTQRNSLSFTSGTFENVSEGMIKQSYLKPNALLSFGVDRFIPRPFQFQASMILQSSKASPEEIPESPKIVLEIESDKKLDHEMVLYLQGHYYNVVSSETLSPRRKKIHFGELKTSIPEPPPAHYYGNYNSQSNDKISYLQRIFQTFERNFSENTSVKKEEFKDYPLAKLFLFPTKAENLPSLHLIGKENYREDQEIALPPS
jgi:hypothetical protein